MEKTSIEVDVYKRLLNGTRVGKPWLSKQILLAAYFCK
jgi:hypothetical protein